MYYILSRHCIVFFCVVIFAFSCSEKPKPKVLVFSKTGGFRHASIHAGKLAIIKLGAENGFNVDTTEAASSFTENNLRKYAAVIFLNSTGNNILDKQQKSDLERFIQAGGGFVGIHAASDTEYEWPWYNKLVGAYFESHPQPQEAVIKIVDHDHPSTKDLPDQWKRFDEWYNFKNINPDIKVLAVLDERTYQGGKNGPNHPFAWYHEFDGGRAFYTEGGHTEEAFKELLYLKHLLGGIRYAIGENRLNYARAKSKSVPEANRFVKIPLIQNLNEPMELVITPDGDVFFIERNGGMFIYEPKHQKTRNLGTLNVYSGFEDGLLGIAIDPYYSNNHFIYLFYSPPGAAPKQHISRFEYRNNLIDLSSEKILIEIPTQREECCHSAGSLAFGKEGDLFIAIGDNTNPRQSDGKAPIDERPGRTSFDAQRTAANTNDLRGKILRIHPEPNGTYSIPAGNLFPPDGSMGRPEIYIMGCRNPYRIAVDVKTNFLYWGDVGPDSGVDSEQGPMSYDEVNQAKGPGNFGWPYFVGNNFAYPSFNFATGKIGEKFNPLYPVNNSVNNTGAKVLPPAQKPLIYYPYAESKEFPWIGKGGRTAMAGPTYHAEKYNSAVKFPNYYDNGFFIYEWMRDWMKVVRIDEDGNIKEVEPILSNFKFYHPIDMEFGGDGSLYLLEYGYNWFAKSKDAQLSRITFEKGNRPAIAMASLSDSTGPVPLKVRFRGDKSYDADYDDIIYEWKFTGNKIESREKNPEFTFTKPGVYHPSLMVTDPKGARTTTSLEVIVGNSLPEIKIETSGNQDFYDDNASIRYKVKVTDKEDKNIDPSRIKVFLDYIPQGYDVAEMVLGHQDKKQAKEEITDPQILASDCKACHAFNDKSIGPSFMVLSETYGKADADLKTKLAQKVINGGSGVWGNHAMSAHPQLTMAVVKDMLDYIFRLQDGQLTSSKISSSGTITFKDHIGKKEKGAYFITASYTDNGAKGLKPLTSTTQVKFLNGYNADKNSFMKNFKDLKSNGIIEPINRNAYFEFKNIDFTDISQLVMIYSGTENAEMTIKLDSPEGKILYSGTLEKTGAEKKLTELKADITPIQGRHNIFYIYENKGQMLKNEFLVWWVGFKIKPHTDL